MTEISLNVTLNNQIHLTSQRSVFKNLAIQVINFMPSESCNGVYLSWHYAQVLFRHSFDYLLWPFTSIVYLPSHSPSFMPLPAEENVTYTVSRTNKQIFEYIFTSLIVHKSADGQNVCLTSEISIKVCQQSNSILSSHYSLDVFWVDVIRQGRMIQ